MVSQTTGVSAASWWRITKEYLFNEETFPAGTLVCVLPGAPNPYGITDMWVAHAIIDGKVDEWRFYRPGDLTPADDYEEGEVAWCLHRLA